MSLSVPIHTSFMSTFFATCRDFEKKPQTLLREIIAYLPRENEFDGSVKISLGFREGEETRTLAEFKGDGPTFHVPGQVIPACPCWSWTDRFQEKIRALPSFPLRNLRDMWAEEMRWFTVRKFAEFYLENSDLTTPLRLPLNRLNVSLDEIIAEADFVLNRDIESLERHFLHMGHDELRGRVCTAWIRQFNEEEEAGILGEGPSLDQGSAMTEHAQPEEQEESQEESQEDARRVALRELELAVADETFRRIVEQAYDDGWARPVQDLPRREHVVNMDNDTNALMNEVLQGRSDGRRHNYHITPQPSAKDTLKEIQSIIDEDVKNLIPEGTYLLLANKMKEAFNRS
jgi:hypothetical protein